MTRVAAIDCGTNSIRLLIADVEDLVITDRVRLTRIVRLGAGVDRTGLLSADGLSRTRDALRDYAATIAEHDVAAVRLVATSATRDAQNRDEFLAMVHTELGVWPDVVTGIDEAALSFAGAASALVDVPGSLLVADIGGGSTELVRGGDGDRLQSHSMDVGCVRLTERHLHDDPPLPHQIEGVEQDVRDALERARRDVSLAAPLTLIGVAGTVTTVAGIALALTEYDPSAIHGARITAEQIHEVTGRLLTMTRAERSALPVLHPGRVDVIVAGALVLRVLIDELNAPALIASEHDILDGIALDLAARTN